VSEERLKVRLVVCLALIQRDKNEILLSLRRNTGRYDGYYTLVAGHVEQGESIKKAVIREAKEEAGILLKEENLTVACTMYRLRGSCIDFYITADKWEGKPYNAESHRCGEIAFYPLNNLPDKTLDFVKLGIKCVLDDVPYVEFDLA
jgi:ADP-ribose pyrophosphatase YjhB (NUDIX family)